MAEHLRNDPRYDWGTYQTGHENIANPWLQTLVDGTHPRMPRRGKVLDLGAGGLRDAEWLVSKGYGPVTAVDWWEGFGTTTIPGIECVRAPIQKFVIEPETYDLIISCQTLFYVRKPDIERVVRRAYKGLTLGGFLIFNLVSVEDDWSRDMDVTAFSEKEILELLKPYPASRPIPQEDAYLDAEGKPVFHKVYFVGIGKK